MPQCLDSVINQTYRNFQHLIFDNGCTDGCTKILQEYAAKYDWVKLIRYDENQRSIDCIKWIDTPYLTTLDSDDWWEPDYLERMVDFLEKNDLDLAITGTVQYFEESGSSEILRKLERPTLFTQRQFAQYYGYFWGYSSTMWATLQKTTIRKETDFTGTIGHAYGGDTMQMLRYIRQCARLGIDNSALYHYRVHPKSITFQYNPRRFDANIAYYEQIKEFLEAHHTLDTEKQEWLKQVHLDSMDATLKLLRDAHIAVEQKLDECLRILRHPLTTFALTYQCEEREQWFTLMWEILFMSLKDSSGSSREKLVEALCILSPDCGKAFRTEDIGLLAGEPALWDAMKADDQKQLTSLLLKLIAEKRFSKQYDLGAVLHRLIPEGSVLREIEDTRFFRTYARDCADILKENNIAALDHMTELLLEGKVPYAREQFLNIYLSLAALENQVPAFLFGKLQLATLYLHEGRKEDCRAVANELAEMGLENEEFSALYRELEQWEAPEAQGEPEARETPEASRQPAKQKKLETREKLEKTGAQP